MVPLRKIRMTREMVMMRTLKRFSRRSIMKVSHSSEVS